MAQVETWFKQDLQELVKVNYIGGNVFSQDNNGNLIGVEVFNNGQPFNLSGSISGNIIRSDGITVAVSGTFSGNRASISLPEDAYLIPGVISIIIKNTVGSQITTLAVCVTNVYQTSTNTIVDSGTIIPSIAALIAAIDEAVASIPADYSSLWATLAPEFSTSINYFAGQYVTYNGALYRFTMYHPAGSWDLGHVSITNIGAELNSIYNKSIESRNLDDLSSEIIQNYYINCSADVGSIIDLTPISNGGFCYAIINCSPGDVFVVSGSSSTITDVCVFVDNTNKVLYKSRPNVIKKNSTVVAPVGATKMVFSVRNTVFYSLCKYVGNIGEIVIKSDETTNSTYGTDITALISVVGSDKIMLGKGSFWCGETTMAAGAELCGVGVGTHIYTKSDSTMISMSNYCAIRNLFIYGDSSAVTPGTKGNKKGVVINQKIGCEIENVTLMYFDNCAIEVLNTGTAINHARSPKLTCVSCYNNYIGLMLGEHGEFNQISNCNFSFNAIGCFNGGGNNIFSNCIMNNNHEVGFYVTSASPDYPNGGHGSATGCIFNHNDEKAIHCVDNHIGYVFSGCQAFYGEIVLDNCGLITFSSCEFGSLDSITINGGKYNLFCNNMCQTDITIVATDANTEFINNKDINGNIIGT